jgi:hypothetical protein
MKIEFIKAIDGKRKKGEKSEVDEKSGKKLIKLGFAKEVKAEKAPKKDKSEKAPVKNKGKK